MADVFPQRNLPGLSEEWGRTVENRVVAGEAKDGQIEQKVDNGLRAANGQLAVLSEQIVELTERQTLVNVLSGSLTLLGNVSGDARNYWSPYEFTITKPRGVVLDTAMRAHITATAGDFGTLVPIVGREVVPGVITILPLPYAVTDSISQLSAGTTFGKLEQRAYLRLPPGSYKLWAGIMLTTSQLGSSAGLSHGISTLTIGQALPPDAGFDV